MNRNVTLIAPLLLLAAVIISCGRGEPYILVPQHWDNTELLVEVRPGAPRVGMNEFVLIATGKDRMPAYQFVVSIQIKGDERWVQMIQDGHSGVYRRALAVKDPVNDVLQVKVEYTENNRENKQKSPKLLSFPISQQVGAKAS